jgi:hypothetical protein
MVSAWWLLLAVSAGVGIGMVLSAILTFVADGNADLPDKEEAAHRMT